MKKSEIVKKGEPTRIVEEPVMLNGRRRDGLVILCNNGRQYTGDQLADLKGMRWPSLYERILREGWDGEDVLRCKGEKKKLKKAKKIIKAAPSDVDVTLLGKGERRQRLEMIKGPSAFERSFLA